MRRMEPISSALAVVILLPALAVGGINDGLISHWRFDEMEGDSAYDYVGDNNGMIYGATRVPSPVAGQALYFDGNDYVQIEDVSDFGQRMEHVSDVSPASSGFTDDLKQLRIPASGRVTAINHWRYKACSPSI